MQYFHSITAFLSNQYKQEVLTICQYQVANMPQPIASAMIKGGEIAFCQLESNW
jgi:hypothetical protein